jgi:hypothetical protein
MKRRPVRRSPNLEALESKLLLSGSSDLHSQPTAALVAPVEKSTAPILLVGTLKGTYREQGGNPYAYTLSESGSLTPIGKATMKGSINYISLTGSASISGKHGKITLSLVTKRSSNVVDYTITGGTKEYAGATGQGVTVFSTVPAVQKGPIHGKNTIVFEVLLAG